VILHIQNKYIRGVATWLFVLAFVAAFPFIVVIGGVVDAWRSLKAEWQSSKGEREHAWRLMTFRSVE
jgi:hypothetical protein